MTTFIKTAVLGAALVWSASAYAAGDAAKGQTVFVSKCKMCHAVDATAKPGVGPVKTTSLAPRLARVPASTTRPR